MLGSSPTGSTALASVSVVNGQVVVVVPADIGRPNADISNSGWLPSAGNDLYAMINEATQDDTNYIYSSRVGDTCRIALGAMILPGNEWKYAGSSSMGNGLTMRLYAGEVIVGTWSHMLTPTNDVYSRQLTQVQSDLLAAGNLSFSPTTT